MNFVLLNIVPLILYIIFTHVYYVNNKNISYTINMKRRKDINEMENNMRSEYTANKAMSDGSNKEQEEALSYQEWNLQRLLQERAMREVREAIAKRNNSKE